MRSKYIVEYIDNTCDPRIRRLYLSVHPTLETFDIPILLKQKARIETIYKRRIRGSQVLSMYSTIYFERMRMELSASTLYHLIHMSEALVQCLYRVDALHIPSEDEFSASGSSSHSGSRSKEIDFDLDDLDTLTVDDMPIDESDDETFSSVSDWDVVDEEDLQDGRPEFLHPRVTFNTKIRNSIIEVADPTVEEIALFENSKLLNVIESSPYRHIFMPMDRESASGFLTEAMNVLFSFIIPENKPTTFGLIQLSMNDYRVSRVVGTSSDLRNSPFASEMTCVSAPLKNSTPFPHNAISRAEPLKVQNIPPPTPKLEDVWMDSYGNPIPLHDASTGEGSFLSFDCMRLRMNTWWPPPDVSLPLRDVEVWVSPLQTVMTEETMFVLSAFSQFMLFRRFPKYFSKPFELIPNNTFNLEALVDRVHVAIVLPHGANCLLFPEESEKEEIREEKDKDTSFPIESAGHVDDESPFTVQVVEHVVEKIVMKSAPKLLPSQMTDRHWRLYASQSSHIWNVSSYRLWASIDDQNTKFYSILPPHHGHRVSDPHSIAYLHDDPPFVLARLSGVAMFAHKLSKNLIKSIIAGGGERLLRQSLMRGRQMPDDVSQAPAMQIPDIVLENECHHASVTIGSTAECIFGRLSRLMVVALSPIENAERKEFRIDHQDDRGKLSRSAQIEYLMKFLPRYITFSRTMTCTLLEPGRSTALMEVKGIDMIAYYVDQSKLPELVITQDSIAVDVPPITRPSHISLVIGGERYIPGYRSCHWREFQSLRLQIRDICHRFNVLGQQGKLSKYPSWRSMDAEELRNFCLSNRNMWERGDLGSFLVRHGLYSFLIIQSVYIFHSCRHAHICLF
eukprot:TRINITY_DN818_c0_g1_i2.p1 TRINITY_DN818_c0_g1~~TRINITY_DN818_c0_g1_i2.p1  ORF type:complete len:849 (-),score=230.07 TRINITY_DN818_c0_g1_i2:1469-4015(-)